MSKFLGLFFLQRQYISLIFAKTKLRGKKKTRKKGFKLMKATGIVRRIDDLGRVVIPKEIRRVLRIREGDPLEIYTSSSGEVILKKYSPINELGQFAGVFHPGDHRNRFGYGSDCRSLRSREIGLHG